MRCPNCGYVIDEPRRREQSRLLHKAIRAYAHAVGYDIDWAKAELKYKHGLFEPVPMDLTEWTPPEWAGAFFEMYEGTPHHTIVFMKSEAALTKDEEAGFIDYVVNRCYGVGADMRWFEQHQEEQSANTKESEKAKDKDAVSTGR